MLVKVTYHARSIALFGQIMLKLCSFFQIMPFFFLKVMLFEKLQRSPKNTVFLEPVGLQERNAKNTTMKFK